MEQDAKNWDKTMLGDIKISQILDKVAIPISTKPHDPILPNFENGNDKKRNLDIVEPKSELDTDKTQAWKGTMNIPKHNENTFNPLLTIPYEPNAPIFENRNDVKWNFDIQETKSGFESYKTQVLEGTKNIPKKDENINRVNFNPFKTFDEDLKSKPLQFRKLNIGSRVGKYIINKFIGEGNFSEIYEASHIYLNNTVAIKTLINSGGEKNEVFLREAQFLAILSHENVVKVYDADIYGGIPCIILEHLEGKTLQNELRIFRNLTLERTLDLLEQLGNVLIRQEEKRILHLDIKPANIFIRPNGSFCLFDYGLLGINEKIDSIIGTPSYMPPEQWRGKADNRSDLFSLGLTAWECFVGHSARKYLQDYGYLKSSEMPIELLSNLNTNFPKELSEIVAHLTAINPKDRYQSASDFIEDLNRFRYSSKPLFGATIGTVFVAIPFSNKFDKIFEVITSACKSVNLKVRRLDQHIFFGRDIWSQCVQELEIAKIVIADFSSSYFWNYPNSNVITEAAHARAINKKLILLKQGKPDDIPFDWRFTPVVSYKKNEDGLKKLEIELVSMLKKGMEE